MMKHFCGSECACRADLDKAAVALAEASRLLSASIMVSSVDLIESCYAGVRAAKAKVHGAMAAYVDHLQEATQG
jgi:hypothetical protein